jgi:DNA-binding IclR family transcriptional regulator
MEDFKPRPGSFLPFLEAKNKRAEAERAKASPLTLLEILARQSRKESAIFDLQGQSGMDPSRYAEALKSLQGAGFIAIEGEGLDQAVRLTDAGAEVVRLAKPA